MSKFKTPAMDLPPSFSNEFDEQTRLVLAAYLASTSGIIITDSQSPDNPIIFCNKAFERITGYSKEMILGRNCRFLQGQTREQKGRFIIQEALLAEQACIVEMLNYKKDGKAFWNELHISPIKNKDGLTTHYVGVQNDITDRKLRQRQTDEELKQALKLQQEKDDFLSVASHELKTPITSLKAILQILAKKDNTLAAEKAADLINRANDSVDRIKRLVDNLLDSTAHHAGNIKLTKNLFVLAEIINVCCLHIRSKGDFSINVEGDLNLAIRADPDKIGQVLTILVDNAVKYARTSRTITVAITVEDDQAKVSVIDQGIGIPQEKQPYLFQRYFKAESNGFPSSGLGLGLYICAEIIQKHHGDIGVESVEGKGSTFWFTLPLLT
ncbi:sensor histidine kinase [Mucilaginibacter aquaedulcis]|uniref:sensor histidine kinase n=1 Tax=Mucilaginibacter aquaedulcis TaxID=1187081 RepID=UPI0025B54B7E|nr:ATP-binding protein [Mucilaginibacter aquaedulcis]MDN3550242.1 ATP-binding protein [Mucilaginibacter aquaedulcis]